MSLGPSAPLPDSHPGPAAPTHCGPSSTRAHLKCSIYRTKHKCSTPKGVRIDRSGRSIGIIGRYIPTLRPTVVLCLR